MTSAPSRASTPPAAQTRYAGEAPCASMTTPATAAPGASPAASPVWMNAIPSVSRIGVYLGRLFPIVSRGVAVNAGDWLQYGKQYWWLLVLGIVFSTPGPEKLWNRIRSSWLGTVILAVLFWACVYCMSVATNDPFMYFSF